MAHYTGIGARKTPPEMLQELTMWGAALGKGLTLRSGAADGADLAFEKGCDAIQGEKEIYLPWEGFNNSDSPLHNIPIEAFEIAGEIYGAGWKHAKTSTRNFMARNMQQVTGYGLDDPSDFILCWTPDGCTTRKERTRVTGGTGQAIAYADELGILVFNLYNENATNELLDFLVEFAEEYGLAE
jgi:hypothetical protein